MKNPTTSSKLTFIAPTTAPVIRSMTNAHNGRVCSTWGNSYYKTFDGDIFYYPGTCNYLFASNCKSNFEDFNIQIKRSIVQNLPTISHIAIKIDGVFIELSNGTVTSNGELVEIPYSLSGVQISRNGIYIRIAAKLGLELMWNEDDAILVELDSKFANQTCGLCGDFNGIPTFNEFMTNNVKLNEVQYGNMQKLNGPTEMCQDLTMTPQNNCTDSRRICEVILTSSPFSDCNLLVDPSQYIEACVQDLCRCASDATGFCLCNTFSEYSRQCAHAGGSPQNWRTSDLCPLTCNFNMEYSECGSPCPNTCSNLERSSVCENHCIDGCFCPAGTVYDDINNSGCIIKERCSCTYNGKIYKAGATYSAQCQTCACSGGMWRCTEEACMGSCAVEGGSHITSFDVTRYNFHGDCNYVLSKTCDSNQFGILGELRKCGLTATETCLKSITLSLNNGTDFIFIKPCGLCGNFNNIQADDFRVLSGVIEGTGSSFANTWKIQADCPSVTNSFENPCALSIENEQYATHWCSMLSDPDGIFAECQQKVNPAIYQQNCMFDSCNCANSEDCMCSALSSYVHACSREGIVLEGWRTNICNKYTTRCPKSFTYSYLVSTCQPTCRSLSEPDITCEINFAPIDGCVCENGTYLDDNGNCVLPSACSCFYKGTAVPPGEVIHDNGAMCTCTQGKLDCVGKQPEVKNCDGPMVYFDCTNKTAGTKGSECQKSCHTFEMSCYSAQCVSGCMCPEGLLADGKGGCISEDQCPCIHNNHEYSPDSTIKVQCNTCKCRNRMWDCTSEACLGSCSVYGDGHYLTFDSKRYSFSGDCEYTLVQDYCNSNASEGTFRIITENIPCGTTGTTCSKAIKVFLGNYELILSDEKFEVVERDVGVYLPYKVHQMGIYMVIEALNGLVLVWDKKTTIFIKLEPSFMGKVCGLCGNYDGNAVNDFTTRSLSVVGDVVEFGNSWKLTPSCPDAQDIRNPCVANPYRKSWAQRQCSIITSVAFSTCHPLVDPLKYYDACVSDACACDTGGDCECFCTAVASYAQACSEAGVCVNWRTPTMCPLFCDFYNLEGHCEWHYKACGAPCMKTCRNPSGTCYHNLPGLEGCYPNCPEDSPYFDEDTMQCVPACNCYDGYGRMYPPGTDMPPEETGTCTTCKCTTQGRQCYNLTDCCLYKGDMYKNNTTIYSTTDGIGGCITAYCSNGGIVRVITDCSTSTTTIPSTTFTFTTTPTVTTTTSSQTTTPSITTVTTVCAHCNWTDWYDVSYPNFGTDKGDFETFRNIKDKGFYVCDAPRNAECRAKEFPDVKLEDLGQDVTCSKDIGLICYNRNNFPVCYNYQIRIECCDAYEECSTPATPTNTPPTTLSTVISTSGPHPPPLSTIPTTTSCSKMDCRWTNWFDNHAPTSDINDGDTESIEEVKSRGYQVCTADEVERNIECEALVYGATNSESLKQIYQCNLKSGLSCNNKEQVGLYKICYNYRIRIQCCSKFCEQTQTPTALPTTSISSTTVSTTSAPPPPSTSATTTPTKTTEVSPPTPSSTPFIITEISTPTVTVSTTNLPPPTPSTTPSIIETKSPAVTVSTFSVPPPSSISPTTITEKTTKTTEVPPPPSSTPSIITETETPTVTVSTTNVPPPHTTPSTTPSIIIETKTPTVTESITSIPPPSSTSATTTVTGETIKSTEVPPPPPSSTPSIIIETETPTVTVSTTNVPPPPTTPSTTPSIIIETKTPTVTVSTTSIPPPSSTSATTTVTGETTKTTEVPPPPPSSTPYIITETATPTVPVSTTNVPPPPTTPSTIPSIIIETKTPTVTVSTTSIPPPSSTSATTVVTEKTTTTTEVPPPPPSSSPSTITGTATSTVTVSTTNVPPPPTTPSTTPIIIETKTSIVTVSKTSIPSPSTTSPTTVVTGGTTTTTELPPSPPSSTPSIITETASTTVTVSTTNVPPPPSTPSTTPSIIIETKTPTVTVSSTNVPPPPTTPSTTPSIIIETKTPTVTVSTTSIPPSASSSATTTVTEKTTKTTEVPPPPPSSTPSIITETETPKVTVSTSNVPPPPTTPSTTPSIIIETKTPTVTVSTTSIPPPSSTSATTTVTGETRKTTEVPPPPPSSAPSIITETATPTVTVSTTNVPPPPTTPSTTPSIIIETKTPTVTESTTSIPPPSSPSAATTVTEKTTTNTKVPPPPPSSTPSIITETETPKVTVSTTNVPPPPSTPSTTPSIIIETKTPTVTESTTSIPSQSSTSATTTVTGETRKTTEVPPPPPSSTPSIITETETPSVTLSTTNVPPPPTTPSTTPSIIIETKTPTVTESTTSIPPPSSPSAATTVTEKTTKTTEVPPPPPSSTPSIITGTATSTVTVSTTNVPPPPSTPSTTPSIIIETKTPIVTVSTTPIPPPSTTSATTVVTGGTTTTTELPPSPTSSTPFIITETASTTVTVSTTNVPPSPSTPSTTPSIIIETKTPKVTESTTSIPPPSSTSATRTVTEKTSRTTEVPPPPSSTPSIITETAISTVTVSTTNVPPPPSTPSTTPSIIIETKTPTVTVSTTSIPPSSSTSATTVVTGETTTTELPPSPPSSTPSIITETASTTVTVSTTNIPPPPTTPSTTPSIIIETKTPTVTESTTSIPPPSSTSATTTVTEKTARTTEVPPPPSSTPSIITETATSTVTVSTTNVSPPPSTPSTTPSIIIETKTPTVNESTTSIPPPSSTSATTTKQPLQKSLCLLLIYPLHLQLHQPLHP
ncbi:mucin-5AC-like [Discoglossus pictus]